MTLSIPGTLLCNDQDRVRVLTFDRPEKKNAFTRAMWGAMATALNDAATNSNVACVVVTGSGNAFTSGLDLSEFDENPLNERSDVNTFEAFISALEAFPKPVLAAVNGVAVGVGVTMLAHCDLVLAAHSARFRAPFVPLGMTAEAASSVLLPERIGYQTTAHFLFTGAWMDAEAALRSGLVWRVESDDALYESTLTLAREIATMPMSSLIATKELLLAGRLDRVRAARVRETERYGQLFGAAANLEAFAAFRERRDPDFRSIPGE
ncbi:MAG: enoyl-CoA hydratase-related protein [Acidimicrobiia bacterium]